MVVRRGGLILGSVGGGRLEADTLQLAAEVFRTRRAVLQVFDLTGADAAGSEMICGGRGEILIDYVDAEAAGNARVFAEAAELLDRGSAGWLLAAFDAPGQDAGSPGEHGLVRPDGSAIGTLHCEPAFVERLLAERGQRSIRVETQGGRSVLVEPIHHGGRLFVFGAGHCSQKLAPLAESVGFKTVVLDDRDEFASRSHFPEPTGIELLGSFDHLPDLGIDENCYLVIMTRGHLHDLSVLEQCLRTRAGYIGMIGSPRKRNMIYEELLRRGFTGGDFERVHAPIGVEIEAETPEEIAISIVGELIKLRAEREQRGARRRSA
jgi:xanthine dehydrogenase accessory factor